MLEVHIAVFLFGLAGLFGKFLSLSPFIIVLGRVTIATISIFTILKLLKIKLFLKGIPLFSLLSLGFILSIHWVSFFHSIQISTVAIGLLSYSSFPVFTVFLEPVFFREKFVKKNFLLSIITFIGIVILIPEMEIKNKVTQGILFGIIAGLTFSILTIFNRKLSQRFPSLLIAFYEDFFASFFLLPFIFFTNSFLIGIKEIILLIFLGLFCTAIAHTLFIKGMKRVKAQIASIIATLEPVYGIILAIIFLREIPALRTIIGGLLIIIATIFVSFEKKEI